MNDWTHFPVSDSSIRARLSVEPAFRARRGWRTDPTISWHNTQFSLYPDKLAAWLWTSIASTWLPKLSQVPRATLMFYPSGSQLGLLGLIGDYLVMSRDIFSCQYWGRGVLASSGQRPGVLLNMQHAQDSPLPTQSYPAPNANSTVGGNPINHGLSLQGLRILVSSPKQWMPPRKDCWPPAISPTAWSPSLLTCTKESFPLMSRRCNLGLGHKGQSHRQWPCANQSPLPCPPPTWGHMQPFTQSDSHLLKN